jgi:hypothetical protein
MTKIDFFASSGDETRFDGNHPLNFILIQLFNTFLKKIEMKVIISSDLTVVTYIDKVLLNFNSFN